MNIEVYTDGSATTSDKSGGYGWVIVIDGTKHSEGSGYMEKASNNDAELEAAIQGLTAAQKLFNLTINVPPQVTLVSDSQLVLGWASGSYRFRQYDKMDKFKELQLLVNLLAVQTRWVEGHTGDEHNERCDKLANAARLGTSIDEKPKKKILKQSVTLIVRAAANAEDLDDLVCQAIAWADAGVYPTGSNYWRTMFVDKLAELMNTEKYLTIEKIEE